MGSGFCRGWDAVAHVLRECGCYFVLYGRCIMSNDETEMWMGPASDSSGVLAENAVLRNVHSAEKCAGQYCVFHNPSDHHMREWPTMYRTEKGLMERICPHGFGHPDPDDAAYHVSRGAVWVTVHGCDGCCKESE